MKPIIFPGLGLEFVISPEAFGIFGWPIHWYGIIISMGFLLAWLFTYREAIRVGENPEVLMDVISV